MIAAAKRLPAAVTGDDRVLPIIESVGRRVLREIDPEQAFEPWAASMADERTVQFIGGSVMDRAMAWRNMAAVIGHWQIRGYGFFSVESRETGEWLGRVGGPGRRTGGAGLRGDSGQARRRRRRGTRR